MTSTSTPACTKSLFWPFIESRFGLRSIFQEGFHLGCSSLEQQLCERCCPRGSYVPESTEVLLPQFLFCGPGSAAFLHEQKMQIPTSRTASAPHVQQRLCVLGVESDPRKHHETARVRVF